MDAATVRLQELLAPLTNYERTRPDKVRWSLEGMRALLRLPGFAMPAATLVQVGGSKGKGTTTLYLEALGASVGLRTGSYLSPHLETMLERVRTGARSVDEATLRRALLPILEHARRTGLEISFFEAMTAAALQCFAQQRVELGVLEVGLGGRLDATTAVPVDAAILTGVELEHTELLGDTVEAIAAEKAWILRAGKPGFTAASGAALGVIEAHARAVGAKLLVLGRDFAVHAADVAGGFEGEIVAPDGSHHRFVLPQAARFEVQALALAFCCLREVRGDLVPPLLPVARPALPGRCEIVHDRGFPLVLDGAHTPGSASCLAHEIERRFTGMPVALLFASARGKRWRGELSSLLPLVDRFLVTGLSDTACEEAAAIVAWLLEQGSDALAVPSAAAGLSSLLDFRGLRVITGSFYLVGEARSLLRSAGICI